MRCSVGSGSDFSPRFGPRWRSSSARTPPASSTTPPPLPPPRRPRPRRAPAPRDRGTASQSGSPRGRTHTVDMGAHAPTPAAPIAPSARDPVAFSPERPWRQTRQRLTLGHIAQRSETGVIHIFETQDETHPDLANSGRHRSELADSGSNVVELWARALTSGRTCPNLARHQLELAKFELTPATFDQFVTQIDQCRPDLPRN